jgi:hypothetical protein
MNLPADELSDLSFHSKPPLIGLFADPHTGSNTALMPAKFMTDDNQLLTASPVQMWLLKNWYAALDEFWERGKGRKKIAIFDGDIIDGNHHGSTQIMPNLADQSEAAIELLEPVRMKVDRMYFVRGTEAHGGEAAHDEVTIAKSLGVDLCVWELLIYLNNQLFNIAHHINCTIDSVVEECVRDAIKMGEPVPDWVVRAHRHIKDDTGVKYDYCRGIVLPAWQLRTGFGFKVSSHRVSDIGFAMIDNGELIMRTYVAPRHIIEEEEFNEHESDNEERHLGSSGEVGTGSGSEAGGVHDPDVPGCPPPEPTEVEKGL